MINKIHSLPQRNQSLVDETDLQKVDSALRDEITETDISSRDSRVEGGLALAQEVYKEMVYIGHNYSAGF